MNCLIFDLIFFDKNNNNYNSNHNHNFNGVWHNWNWPSFIDFWEKKWESIFSENTQKNFAYIPETKYFSRAILHSKQMREYLLSHPLETVAAALLKTE